MNTMHSASSFLSLKPSPLLLPHCHPQTRLRSCHSVKFPLTSPNLTYPLRSSISAAIPSNEGTVSVVEFEDFVEKDWSFLETDDINSDHIRKMDRIISAGEIAEPSKVMIYIGSEAFVDRVVNSSPCEQLLIVHDSLFVLACIKEKYDKVKCWQGELINVPEKWTAFDVVFLYFLPALPFELDLVLASLSRRCLPGNVS